MLKLKKIKLVLRCLCLLWGESGKPTDLLFLGKTPCPELPTHLPGLIICICSDIHWKILPDILLALVSVMERRARTLFSLCPSRNAVNAQNSSCDVCFSRLSITETKAKRMSGWLLQWISLQKHIMRPGRRVRSFWHEVFLRKFKFCEISKILEFSLTCALCFLLPTYTICKMKSSQP